MNETFWQGEAEARIKGAEARLNSLNGDLRGIHQEMAGFRADLGSLKGQVNNLQGDVTELVKRNEEQRKEQITTLQSAIEQSRIKTRNLIFALVVPLIAAVISGLIPYLILGGAHGH